MIGKYTAQTSAFWVLAASVICTCPVGIVKTGSTDKPTVVYLWKLPACGHADSIALSLFG